jgi:hypothetical protein
MEASTFTCINGYTIWTSFCFCVLNSCSDVYCYDSDECHCHYDCNNSEHIDWHFHSPYSKNFFFKSYWWALGKPTRMKKSRAIWCGGPRMTRLSGICYGQLVLLSYYTQQIIKEFRLIVMDAVNDWRIDTCSECRRKLNR